MLRFTNNSTFILFSKVMGVLLLIGINGLYHVNAQSAKALYFDGNDDYVEVDDVSDNVSSGSVTVEAWYKSATTNYDAIFAFNKSDKTNRLLIYNKAVYDYGTQTNNAYNTAAYGNSKWHHLAVVYDNSKGQIEVYIDGIQDQAYSTSIAISSSDLASIGQEWDGSGESNHFQGKIDEVRVWSEARDKADIRDKMTETLTGNETNLAAYWHMDDGSGSIATDAANGNDGTLKNGPTWKNSGVPLGNKSTSSYSPVSLNIDGVNSNNGNESFRINNFSGSPDAAHLIRVESKPNYTSGFEEVSKYNYFVVYVVGGSTPQYDVTYTYEDHPDWQSSSEGDLRLGKRNNNTVTTWSNANATQNIGSVSNFTKSGEQETQSEYILASTSSNNALPVELTEFQVDKANMAVDLSWATASETNNSHFLIQRRTKDNWENIGKVNGNGTTTVPQEYKFIDEHPQQGTNYYRLKQVDFDGSHEYSGVRAVTLSDALSDLETAITVLENPVQNQLRLNIRSAEPQPMNYKVVNSRGHVVRQGEWEIDQGDQRREVNMQSFPKGTYFLQVQGRKAVMTKQVVN